MLVALALSASTSAQRPAIATAVRPFVKLDAPVIALVHARVIDGTGAPARADQTLIIRDDRIAAVGPAATTAVPEGATVVDLTGKSVIPGLVMLHEHLYYPVGPNVYGQLGQSFTRLYLAGGVTTMRTGGNTNGVMDIVIKQRADRGEIAAPAMDATAPYLEGPNTQLQMHALTGPDDARAQVNYWAGMGATSFKAYMNITRAQLGAAIDEAHKRGLKVTGHLCSVTYGEAVDLGIDNLEHGFLASTDFVAAKQPDVCPGQATGQRADRGPRRPGAPFRRFVKKLVDSRVALTSTMTVFETFARSTDAARRRRALPQLKESRSSRPSSASAGTSSRPTRRYCRRAWRSSSRLRGPAHARGRHGPDRSGAIPGFSNQRQDRLLVEAGFTPPKRSLDLHLDGAKYLGRDSRIGSGAAAGAGRSGGSRRRSVHNHRRHSKRRDRLSPGHRLRPGEASSRLQARSDLVNHRPCA